MKDWNFSALSSILEGNSGGLSVIGWSLLTGICFLAFIMVGLILGNSYFRRCRGAVLEFHEENQRGIVRVENYRATIDKQLRSEQRLESDR